MRKKSLIAFFSIVSVLLLCNRAVLAAETDANTEDLNQSVNQLIEVKDDKSISEAERLAKELEARKQVVKDALSLSLKEISGLETSLKALKSKDERVIAFQKSSLEYLESAKAFYEEKAELVDSIEDLEEIKSLAQTIKDYRDAGYNTTTERINNFLLLSQTDNLIKVAQTRWTKIDADLNKLERGQFISYGYFDANMEKAQKYINDAADLSNEAKEHILKEFDEEVAVKEAAEAAIPVEDNDSAPITMLGSGAGETPGLENQLPAPTSNTEKTEPATTSVVNPKELAEASLTNLKSSYDVFLKISQSVKKILQ
jgi:uncharacterized protein YfkK (UPF0435 family)